MIPSRQPHFLIVAFPVQGHINPALQLAKNLTRNGALVTFATTIHANKRMSKLPNAEGLQFAAFSDGYDDGRKPGDSNNDYMFEIKHRGSQTLRDLITSIAREGRPVTCLVYTMLLSWAAEVSREFHVPSVLLWVQSATVLDIFHYYFYGRGALDVREKCNDSEATGLIRVPGLPMMFRSPELPSFILSTCSKELAALLPSFKEQFDVLEMEDNPRVLVNTFDALEPEALRAIGKYRLTGVGPLVPSAFSDGKDPLDSSFGGDLFRGTKDYMAWLDSKSEASVIYIAFGSVAMLSKKQMEELAGALLGTGRPFLWVIRAKPAAADEEQKEHKLMSCMGELEKFGMIVPWCSQLEVLSHPSIGCFITHCGWNSTIDSLVVGVPVIGLPQWIDQGTNAKLIADAWGTGVRARVSKDGIVERKEIERCLDIVMGHGEERDEMRRNALKWKELARDAAKEGGSSNTNFKALMEDVYVTQVCRSRMM